MKWITREHVKVDRVACPWLMSKDALYEYCRERVKRGKPAGQFGN